MDTMGSCWLWPQVMSWAADQGTFLLGWRLAGTNVTRETSSQGNQAAFQDNSFYLQICKLFLMCY